MSIENLLTYFGETGPFFAYLAILGILILSGFGLPLPEDLPLIVGGYLCAYGYASAWIMLPGCLLAILGADGLIFALGRRYGHHVPRLPLLRRYLTEERLRWAEHNLDARGGKFIFLARFLPGFRTPVFFVSGGLRLPYWRFLIYDGVAACISVPAIFFLAYYFAEQINAVKRWVTQGQLWAILAVVVGIGLFFLIKTLVKKRMTREIREANEASSDQPPTEKKTEPTRERPPNRGRPSTSSTPG